MNVTLDPRDKDDLEAMARVEGRDPTDLLREIVHQAISERKLNGQNFEKEANLLARQQVAMQKLLGKLDTLPENEPQDGLCASVDHDKILYGASARRQEGGSSERRS